MKPMLRTRLTSLLLAFLAAPTCVATPIELAVEDDANTNNDNSNANSNGNDMVVPRTLEVLPLFSSAADWGDYVVAGDGEIIDAAGDACAPDASGGYHACVHGGELRAAQMPSGFTCLDLEPSDELGAFEWRCAERSDGTWVYSVGLRFGRGLTDLLVDDDFAENRLFVHRDGALLARSDSRVWGWANPFANVVGGANQVFSANVPGTIYRVKSTTVVGGIDTTADRTTLVIDPGAVLTQDTSTDNCDLDSGSSTPGTSPDRCWIVSNADFLWVEGTLSAQGRALFFKSTRRPRLHQVEVAAAYRGLELRDTHATARWLGKPHLPWSSRESRGRGGHPPSWWFRQFASQQCCDRK
jgi:hypothetical protein